MDSKLLPLVHEAHYRSALENRNASSVAFLQTWSVTKDITKSIISALCTTGDTHAPIRQARDVYRLWTLNDICKQVWAKQKVAGFGNSFHKEEIDPIWRDVATHIQVHESIAHDRIMHLQENIYSATKGKLLFPNAAMFTAVYCELEDVPYGTEMALFATARIPAWVSLVGDYNGS